MTVWEPRPGHVITSSVIKGQKCTLAMCFKPVKNIEMLLPSEKREVKGLMVYNTCSYAMFSDRCDQLPQACYKCR